MLMQIRKINPHKIAKYFSYLCLIVFCMFAVLASIRIYNTWKVTHLNKELKELKAEIDDKRWDNGLIDLNEDYIGWITIYGTTVDAPVVQSKDNNDYLRKDFNGNYSIAGTLFMDYMVDGYSETDNRIIYGHMMRDNTMFGSLKKYKSLNFFKENNIVYYKDCFGEHYYKLFAALTVAASSTDTEYLNIQEWAKHLDKEGTETMLGTLKDRAYIFQDDIRGENQYIFLVTCDLSRGETGTRLILVGEEMEK